MEIEETGLGKHESGKNTSKISYISIACAVFIGNMLTALCLAALHYIGAPILLGLI